MRGQTAELERNPLVQSLPWILSQEGNKKTAEQEKKSPSWQKQKSLPWIKSWIKAYLSTDIAERVEIKDVRYGIFFGGKV